MIPYHRSSERGLHLAVCLLAVLTVVLSPRPLAAAPRADAAVLPELQPGAAVPTRIEGQIKNITGDRWLVDQTWVKRTSSTVLFEARGAAEVGAWVLVAGSQFSDALVADSIQVLRPSGAPLPLFQFTGILKKMGSPGWLVGETPIVVTPATRQVGQPTLEGLVRVTARRVNNDLQALEVAQLAATSGDVPFAIEGKIAQVSDQEWVVDDQPIVVPAGQKPVVNQGDTVEVAAVKAADGTLVAQQTRVVDVGNEAALDGYVAAVDGLGQDNQTWQVVAFEGGRPVTRSVKITAETYVDEDRALIEPDVEALVQGQKSGAASVDAQLVRLEQTASGSAAGALAQLGPDGLWRVGDQTVWFASDVLKQQAMAAAGVRPENEANGIAGNAASSTEIAVAGVRLKNGVLIAKELAPVEAAQATLAATTDALAANGLAAGWSGPNDILPSVSQASKPTVLFDAAGAGHAVFESAGKIYYAYQPPRGAWTTPRKIGTGVTPTAVLDPQGRVNVAYASEFLGNWDILHVRMTGQGWSLATVVAPTTGSSVDPAIAADSTGRIYVAWMDRTSGEYAIQLGTFDGNFWTSYPVPNARGQSPALSVMPDGALFLAWQDRLPQGTNLWGNYDIFATERAGKVWSTAVNISDNSQFRPGSNALGARVVSSQDSLAHLAWIDDTTQIRYDFGRGLYWPVPTNVGTPRTNAEGLSMLLAPDGLLYLAWNEGNAIRVIASPPRTQDWPAADTVATRSALSSGRVSDVSLTAGHGGGVAVAWVQDNTSGTMGVYESRHNMARPLLRSFVPFVLQP